MQIIYKMDVFFLKVYSAVILLVGVLGSIALGNLLLFVGTVIVQLAYLFFALARPYKRYKAVREPFPPEWRDVLAMQSIFYRNLNEQRKGHFERDVVFFLSSYSVEGIRRQPVDLRTRLIVAAAVAAMLHGRPYWEPPIHDGVVVYPGARFDRHYQRGRGNFAGMASYNGPLILTEGGIEESLRNPNDGYNVIFHELAHYFDLEDGRADGVPSAGISAENQLSWKTLFTKEWNRVVAGHSFLRPYAGQNEAEFFAVATESFFENPWKMKEKNPELYDALKSFYNLDTAEFIKPV
ncbi:MAG: zinc-dependent peptidase [bacterium]|nr:zinc-dependent peptidase [bacterium]